jgi:hypothetical protein
VVQPIFVEEEGARSRAGPLRALGDGDDVAAGAEAAAVIMVDDHRLDLRLVQPLDQGGGHRQHHVEVEGVNRLGAVEAEAARAAFDAGNDGGLGHGTQIPSPFRGREGRGCPALDITH